MKKNKNKISYLKILMKKEKIVKKMKFLIK